MDKNKIDIREQLNETAKAAFYMQLMFGVKCIDAKNIVVTEHNCRHVALLLRAMYRYYKGDVDYVDAVKRCIEPLRKTGRSPRDVLYKLISMEELND
jgi:hypothetical protein